MSASLIGADASYASLQLARLIGATVHSTAIARAKVQLANLTGANVEGSILKEADLRGADLRGASFKGVDLREAQLQLSDLRDAEITGSDLRGAALWGVFTSENTDLTLCDLRGISMYRPSAEAVSDLVAWLEIDATTENAQNIRARLTAKDKKGIDNRPVVFKANGLILVDSPDHRRWRHIKRELLTSDVNEYDEKLVEYLSPIIEKPEIALRMAKVIINAPPAEKGRYLYKGMAQKLLKDQVIVRYLSAPPSILEKLQKVSR